MTVDMGHMQFLIPVQSEDLARVREKEATYKGSWKKRGGEGAFHMLARKWDRLENQLEQTLFDCPDGKDAQHTHVVASKYDIFAHVAAGGHPDGVLDDIRDLRTYLLLVEAELMSQGVVASLEDTDAPD